MKILVCDKLADEGIAKLREAGEVLVRTGLSEDELVQAVADAAAIVVRSGTKVTRRVIEAAPELKVIGRAGVGVDNIDLYAATERGVVVCNSPGGNTIAAAEHTIGLMLAISRKIPMAHASLRRGEWNRSAFLGTEVRNKVLGIIGLGRIGREVARRARGLDMEVIGYDPALSDSRCRELGVEPVELDELLEKADYVTLHVPLNDSTRHMIGREQLAKMKRGAFLINCSRGGVVDEEALAEAVESGHLAGAALDVYEGEPEPFDSPVMRVENIVTTPHLGASTAEAQVSAAVDVAEQVVEVLRGGQARNAVNMPPIPAESREYTAPYMHVAEKLGAFLAHLIPGGLNAVDIEYAGGLRGYDCSYLTRSVMVGLLGGQVSESVNLVNALSVAYERGIRLDETKSGLPTHFHDLITVRAEGDRETHVASATLRGIDEPRIVQIDEYRVDIVPEGIMLLLYHRDQPGVIGRCGTILGEANVNIGQMHVGRNVVGGTALMILNLDDPVPPEALEKIKSFEPIEEVKLLEL